MEDKKWESNAESIGNYKCIHNFDPAT